MAKPPEEPIGLKLTRTAKLVSRRFDDELAAAGGSLPTWLVLVSLKGQAHATQRELAAAVGIEGPTLTHHLNRLETDGLVTRRRDPANRRVHQVELTTQGDAAFNDLLGTVAGFDARLRAGFSVDELVVLRGFLDRLQANAIEERQPEVTT
jgi:MarR family transcriptional regulator for hemolysin